MDQYREIAEKIKAADAILIGASNGLSITEGLHLFADNDAFDEVFGDYKEKYGLRCILDGIFYHWNTIEEKWGFLSRLIMHYSGSYKTSEVMNDLKKIVGEKPYFVLTSNGEGHFELSGFEANKIYELEGNWIEMRCSRMCHEEVYPSLPAIRGMAAAEQNGTVPNEKIPKCPKCGAVMELYTAQPPKQTVIKEWETFLRRWHNKKIVILELGIGWRNQLIKKPLMQLTAREPQATYVTINLGEIYIPDNIREKSYGLDGYLSEQLKRIANIMAEPEEDRAFQEMLQAAVQRLKKRSGSEIAAKSGAAFDSEKNMLEIQSLSEKIETQLPDFAVRTKLEKWHHLVLLHYLDVADGTPVSQELITFGNLKDGLIRGTRFDHTTDLELQKILKDQPEEKIQKACKTLGAQFIETKADLCAVFSFLPFYPVTLKIWYTDDEFPATGKLFLHGNADHYLSVEDAVTVGEIMLRKLKDCFNE